MGHQQAARPTKGVYYDLYVIIDIFSHYVVGWMVAPTETAELVKAFIAEDIKTQGITGEVLTIHADRGSSMTSKPVAALLAELGVARTHSRPHVSNDNPHSEAAFKTLRYSPAFPDRFGSIANARVFCAEFFDSAPTRQALGRRTRVGPASSPPTSSCAPPSRLGSIRSGAPSGSPGRRLPGRFPHAGVAGDDLPGQFST